MFLIVVEIGIVVWSGIGIDIVFVIVIVIGSLNEIGVVVWIDIVSVRVMMIGI